MSPHILIPVDFNPFEEEKEIDKIVPTNEPQQEIWLSCAIGGDEANLAYNESVSLNLYGDFNQAFFTTALKEVIARHEALRASVSANGETLIIYKQLSFDIPFEDISAAADQKAVLDQFVAEEMEHVFDLQEGPLFRVFLHKLSETHYYFTLVKHHVIGDGWSTGVILEDLSKLYNAAVKGEYLLLDDAPQISLYAEQQTAYMLTEAYQQTKNYWLKMYEDSVPVLNLPVDYPRPASRTYKADRFDEQLPLELVEQLKVMGAKAGCSLVNTLLSAFEIFLYLQTNQREIVVGLPAAGQAATENFQLVGHCVNLLPLKSSIDPDIPFNTYLKNRKSAFFDAYDNQQFTYGQLIKGLNITRDPSRVPLVPVVFNIDMGMDNSVAFENLTYKLVSNLRKYETFEIFLNATGSKSSFILEWSYNTQLFKAATIEKMAAAFEQLLRSIVHDPSVTIKDLSAQNNSARIEQLNLWNNTAAFYPKEQHLTALIDEISLKFADKAAVRYKNETLNYSQLTAISNQLAAYLIKNNIKTGDIIGLSAERSMEMLVCLLGILKAGAVYVPLDPEYPQERIEYMLEDSGAKILLVSAAYSGKFASDAAEHVIEKVWDELDQYSGENIGLRIDGKDLAYILYTSGSTGKPKGVKIKHHNLINFLTGMQVEPGISAEDRLLAITTISFDIAGLELYLPLITGAELIICDIETARDGRLLLDTIAEKGITIMQATPSTWRMMIDSGWNKIYDLKILCGGEALPKDLADNLVERSSALWNMYGPTETTIWSTVKQIKKGESMLTIGRPIQNTQIYILNEDLELLAPGTEGEIFIAGDGLAAGYLNQPALTDEKFIKDPFSAVQGAKMYRTGDLGNFLDNGEIRYLGRIDQQVKIRGHRIELGEIETQLSKQEGVKQAVVLAREDNPGDKRLVAYVVLAEDEVKDVTPSWKDRWDTIYDMAAQSSQDVALDEQKIDGILLEQWENSDDLVLQAAEWLDESAKRIKQLNAGDILEIGSGGGQLLFELAPFAKTYMATDYAGTAIEKLKQKLNVSPDKWTHVKAHANAADDFSGIAGASFDLILIHSVAQYFPDTSYFLKVIEESVKKIKDGGCLFIGDMQGKNSLEMYHAMDHLGHSKNDSTLAEFKEVVRNRVRIEDEFVADPGFFYLLPNLIPAITGVDIQLRAGKSLNETTKYHYDVWIYVNSKHEVVEPELSLEWKDLGSMHALTDLLETRTNQTVEIKHIFNSRTAPDYMLSKLMASAPEGTAMEQIKAEVQAVGNGIHPDLFWQLGKEKGYHTHIRWSDDATDGNFDVLFIPGDLELKLPPPSADIPLAQGKAGNFARIPLSTNELYIAKSLTDQWRDGLKHYLPDYMLPSDFVALKSFPLTPNHKIDKKALPKPQLRKTASETEDNTPLDESEKIISGIWSAVLGLDNINKSDDFFELGGHSLLAVKVMAAIEKETGRRLPLASLFENATIEKLAKKIQTNEDEKWDALVPIKTTGTKDPIFMVHGGGLNVLLFKTISKYLGEDQPVYGLQAIGLNKKTQLFFTIEEIAAIYVAEVLEVNPEGPFSLTGYSLGGFIAFEMARQLTEMGKEIKFLGILDTYAGNKDIAESDTQSKLTKKVKRQFNKIPFFTKSFMESPVEAFNYQLHSLKFKFDNLFSHENEDYIEHFTAYEKEIYSSYDIAHQKYILKPSDVKISLFSVKKRLYYLDDQVYLGWNKFAKKGVEIYNVPGDHKTFLYPPNDEEFAQILQHALDHTSA
jgi:amino acid adenylation domain-containing protein